MKRTPTSPTWKWLGLPNASNRTGAEQTGGPSFCTPRCSGLSTSGHTSISIRRRKCGGDTTLLTTDHQARTGSIVRGLTRPRSLSGSWYKKAIQKGDYLKISVINVNNNLGEKNIVTMCKLVEFADKDDIKQYEEDLALVANESLSDQQEFI